MTKPKANPRITLTEEERELIAERRARIKLYNETFNAGVSEAELAVLQLLNDNRLHSVDIALGMERITDALNKVRKG
jgi:hypothetical protein